jgi:bla regulator protein blaR1
LVIVLQRGDRTLAAPTLCMESGQIGEVHWDMGGNAGAWRLLFDVTPASAGQVQVHLTGTAGGQASPPLNATLRDALGQVMKFKIADADTKGRSVDLSITPSAGCAAFSATTSAEKITVHLVNIGARSALVSIAGKAGLTVTNPQLLDDRLVTFNFEQIPVGTALQLITSTEGKKAVVDGRSVHVESK